MSFPATLTEERLIDASLRPSDAWLYRPLKNKSRLRGYGSLCQMSMGNNMGFYGIMGINVHNNSEEVKAASRFELHTFYI